MRVATTTKITGAFVLAAVLAVTVLPVVGMNASAQALRRPTPALAQIHAPGATATLSLDRSKFRSERPRVERLVAAAAPVERYAVEDVSSGPLEDLESTSVPQGTSFLSPESRAPPVVRSRS